MVPRPIPIGDIREYTQRLLLYISRVNRVFEDQDHRLHDMRRVVRHDPVDVSLGGQEISQQPECLHENSELRIGEEPEYLIGTETLEDLRFDALLGLEGDVHQRPDAVQS